MNLMIFYFLNYKDSAILQEKERHLIMFDSKAAYIPLITGYQFIVHAI